MQGHLSFCFLCSLLCGSVCSFIKCSISSGVPHVTHPHAHRSAMLVAGLRNAAEQMRCLSVHVMQSAFPPAPWLLWGTPKKFPGLFPILSSTLGCLFVCLFCLLAIVPFNRTV